MTAFVSGRQLSRVFYEDSVRPLVSGWPHAAALLGWGSDVLGYDTPRSTDHGWGPRLLLFVAADAVPEVRETVATNLPETVLGWPVRFGWDQVPVDDQVTVADLRSWVTDYLGFDATDGVSRQDWLLTPQQRLLGVVSGAVHADQIGALTALRQHLQWYPDDVWRWLIACQWHRVAQEEAFVQRTAEVNDHPGSALVAARLVRDAVRLALLLARRYAPYTKWLGTAFSELSHQDHLDAHLQAALRASDSRLREEALAAGYQALARRYNALQFHPPLDPWPRPFYGRPARVLMADRFSDACLASIRDPQWQRLGRHGSVDQVVDSTDVLESPARWRALAPLYSPVS